MSQQLRSAEMLREKARREEERLERLVARCGPAFHLVPDNLLLARYIRDHHPPGYQAGITIDELRNSVTELQCEPLMTALQAGRATAAATAAVQCRHCQPSEPLTIRYLSFSGSSAEGLYDLAIGEGGMSDFDIMLEFGGPFRWATGEDCISTEAAPQLYAKPSSSPGFVTLYWTRTSRCRHEAPLEALPADFVRRLMWYRCRVLSPPDAEITRSGPAVNVRTSNANHGGTDHVPCLRLPWWPEKDVFLCRRRVTDFPPAATRRDICRFGVHLVPTGRPGSETEQSEYRVSFSRAEVITVRHLSPVQHGTIRVAKDMKNTLRDTGAGLALKSYYIKTAVLWLAQDQPSERWTGVTAGVNMVLDWLEHHLRAGHLPCFYWPAISLLAGLETAMLKDIINTIQLMRRQANRLMMAWCDRTWIDLDTMLEGGSEPLSERQLRFRLTRYLVLNAVVQGILYRSTAPCWEHWFRLCIPALSRLSQHRLLQWGYRWRSGKCMQQCYLLQALAVAPADLVPDMHLTSLGDDMFAWPVTPLLNLLTERDMETMLHEPAAVAAWCRQQLCRPPAERPAGLTVDLNTPRGRAELLLQPELFLRAVSETVPALRNWWQRHCQREEEQWRANYQPLDTYQLYREAQQHNIRCDLQSRLRHRLPELDGLTAAATARLWRQNIQHLLSGDRLREAYTAVTTHHPVARQMAALSVPHNGRHQGR